MQSKQGSKARKYLLELAASPRAQLKRLSIGTLVSLCSFLLLVVTSEWENQWLFYVLSIVIGIAVLYAIPGYLGIWAWRMKDVIEKQGSRQE